MVSKKGTSRCLLHNFNGAMEQNVLKLLEALVDNHLEGISALPDSKESRELIIY